jgi:hypothetical protein
VLAFYRDRGSAREAVAEGNGRRLMDKAIDGRGRVKEGA